MTATAKDLIRHTFSLIEPRAGLVALIFYQRLFQLAPATKEMFVSDIEAQGIKFMQMLRTITGSLDDPGSLIPMLKEMGLRHAGYGVRDEHYDNVRIALIKTLADALGKHFTPGANAAWTAAYDWIAVIMKQGAATIAPPAEGDVRRPSPCNAASSGLGAGLVTSPSTSLVTLPPTTSHANLPV
jgi:hemoglobin-like flavoprotein